MTVDDVLDWAEPSLLARRALYRAGDQASLGQWQTAREFIAKAAEQLVEMELAVDKLQAAEEMRHEHRLFLKAHA